MSNLVYLVLLGQQRLLGHIDETAIERDLSGVLDWVRSRCALCFGAAAATQLRNDGYDFMQVGLDDCEDYKLIQDPTLAVSGMIRVGGTATGFSGGR